MANNIVYRISAVDLLSGALRNINRAADETDKTMSNLGKTIAGVISVAGAVEFGKKMLDAGTKVENARIGLGTLMKDQLRAQSVIDTTMADAAKSPFDFEQLLMGRKLLISAGASAKESREDIMALANAIAATGGGNEELSRMAVNMQQIKNVGKAAATDLKQFAYAGINMTALLQSQGLAKYDKKGNLVATYKDITTALKNAQKESGLFYHGLENMQGSVTTQMANVGDAMFGAFAELFTILRPQIIQAVYWVQDLVKQFGELTKWLAKNKQWLDIVSSALKAMALIISIRMIPSLIRMAGAALLNAANFLSFGAATTTAAGEVVAANTAMSVSTAAATLGMTALIGALIGGIFYMDKLNQQYQSKVVEFGQTEYGKRLNAEIATLDKIRKNRKETFEVPFFGRFNTRTIFSGPRSPEEIAQIKKEVEQRKAISAMDKAKKILDTDVSRLLDMMNKDVNEKVIEANRAKAMKQLEGYQSILSPEVYAAYKSKFTTPEAMPKLPTPPGKPTKTKSTSGVSGPKITTINITMKNLVGEFQVTTNNMKEGANNAKDIVVAALTQALNDAQAIV